MNSPVNCALVVLTLSTVLACGAINVTSDPGGAAGESCTKKADCRDSLQCVANVCADPNAGTTGTDSPATDGAEGTADAAADGAADAADGAVDTPADATDATDGEPPLVGCPGYGECVAGWRADGSCQKECNCAEFGVDDGDCYNSCTSDPDRAIWTVAGFELQPGDCWQGCVGDQGCTDSCLQGTTLTAPCSLCFAAYIGCFAANCDQTCLDEPARADCETCSSTSCWQAFYNCSGAL